MSRTVTMAAGRRKGKPVPLIWRPVDFRCDYDANDKTQTKGVEVWRAKVPGGWLVTTGTPGTSYSVLTFYPDPEHAWERQV